MHDAEQEQEIVDDGNPETNEPFNVELVKLRTLNNWIKWGHISFALSENKIVAQFGWRDNNLVLFATTIGDPTAMIIRKRKRPSKRKKGAAKTRKAFGDEITKDMEIPVLIDEYNHHMGGVDIFDQLKSYHDTLRVHRKTWRPLFSYLLEIALTNSFKLSSFSDPTETKRSGHRHYLLKLVAQLEKAAGKAVRFNSQRRRSVNDLKVRNGLIHVRGKLNPRGKEQPCVVCQARGHREPLQPMDLNQSTKPGKSRRTAGGCVQCDVPLCSDCCKEHLQAANETDTEDSEE